MTRQAFLHAFGVSEGDPYDPARIQARFRSLWGLKLFEDITVDAEEAPGGGKALVVKVRERPVLSSITYDDSSVVTRTQIEDRYKERDIGLAIGKPLDMGAVFFAESSIRDLMGEKGYLDATVKAEVREVTTTTRAVHFNISAGGKTRIRKIDFTGNEVFKDRKLKKQLQLTQERKWYWPWSGKNLYHPIKWDQDVGGIRNLYQNAGYLDIELRAPVVEVRQTKKGKKKAEKAAAKAAREAEKAEETVPEEFATVPTEPLTAKQQKKLAKQRKKELKKEQKAKKKASKPSGKRWVYLTVPVSEGVQYSLGEITFSGNEVYPDEVLRSQIPVADGAILNNGLIERGTDRITRIYEDRGYLYASVVRRIRRQPEEPIADVEVIVEEDKPYYVAEISFSGNSETHDRVLRRELQLIEGELFSRTKLDVSRLKVNQLGYFQVTEEPVIEPIEEEQRVKITIPGQEQGRNEIQVGGGYSGLDGAFFNGVYSTRNFLGRGQILSAALQVGSSSNRYQISFQEPYFLGKPYLLGVSVFRRDTDFGSQLESTATGFGITLGKQLTRFSRITLAYNWQSVESESFVRGTTSLDPVRFRTDNDISSLTPVFAYSTINNPYRPSRGTQFRFSTQIAGGFLGGDTSFLKPLASYTTYKRTPGRTILAFNAEAGIIREFESSDQLRSSSDIEGVPRFERFWLGGETLGPRVFETRTITPRRYVILDDDGRITDVVGDPRGLPAGSLVTSLGVPVDVEVGGDRMFLFQTELVRPLNEQAEVAAFLDFGDTLFEDTSLGLDTVRVSAGFEVRFHLPIFPVPLRLIYGWPLRKIRGDDTSNFTFSIGRAF